MNKIFDPRARVGLIMALAVLSPVRNAMGAPRPSPGESHGRRRRSTQMRSSCALPESDHVRDAVADTEDFAAIGSVFANHLGDIQYARPRRRSLHPSIPTACCAISRPKRGYGIPAGSLQGGRTRSRCAIPPCTGPARRRVFSMVIGAPTEQYGNSVYYWQIYEITGFGEGETASDLQGRQPAATTTTTCSRRTTPTATSFSFPIACGTRRRWDRPICVRGDRYLYPQLDEYESAPTPTGLWKLDPATGELWLMQHSVSGSSMAVRRQLRPRDLHALGSSAARSAERRGCDDRYGTFNYSGEGPESVPTLDRTRSVPRAAIHRAAEHDRHPAARVQSVLPVAVIQDGTGEETLNHIGRHELQNYFNHTFNTDPDLHEFFFDPRSARISIRSAT